MSKIFIIAEAGVNHNGSLELAERLLKIGADAGADAVKFQTFKSKKLVAANSEKAAYQKKTSGGGESQLAMLQRLELPYEAHHGLQKQSAELGVEFLSTPFDHDSLRFLVSDLKLPKIKIGSGDVDNAPLLLEAAQSGLPMIVSTGNSTLQDIERSLGVIAFGYLEKDTGDKMAPGREAFVKAFQSDQGQKLLREKLTLLHCTSEYPAPFADVNLNAMSTLKKTFGLPLGLSDHTVGIAVPTAAAALGATVIEKHFTYDRGAQGPDHQASLGPEELRAMVKAIRDVETAMGSFEKKPSASELKNKNIIRRSVMAARDIKKGEVIAAEDLIIMRPGTGLSPFSFWECIGKPAKRDFKQTEMIEL